MCANLDPKDQDLKLVSGVQYDGDPQTIARAAEQRGNSNIIETNGSGDETVIKKRKTRRGKPKRRNTNSYNRPAWQQRRNRQMQFKYNRKYRSKITTHGQAFAPYNSNQFLMEDHGNLQELDDKLNRSDGAGSSLMPSRTRDSSFSVDSDADFYSSPEDEEEFLTREFDNAYEDLHNERLHGLSKDQLIIEYLQLETKVDVLTKKLKGKSTLIEDDSIQNTIDRQPFFQQEMNRLIIENEDLRRENEMLRNGVCRSATPLTSSEDSESDSSSSTCHSSSSSNPSEAVDSAMTPTPNTLHSEINGYSPHPSSPNVV